MHASELVGTGYKKNEQNKVQGLVGDKRHFIW